MRGDASHPLLCASTLSVQYGDKPALTDLDLTIQTGETIGLLGLNGAGKSTLLKVLCGVRAAQTGTVSIDGLDLHNEPLKARRLLGYAPDKPPLYPEFKTQEYLRFAASLRGIKRHSLQSSVSAVIEKCGLGDVKNRVIGNLSHGFQQRINLAQAMVHEPKLLILDEPTNGLDPAQLLEIRDVIKNRGAHCATIFSSHQLSEVQANCQRVVLIDAGRKVLDLSMNQLTDSSHSTFEVRLKQAASQQDFQRVPGVISACSVNPQHWLLTTHSDRDASKDRFGELMLTQGLQLLKVTPVRDHLETLFSLLRFKSDDANKLARGTG